MRRLSFYLLLVFVFAVPWENVIQIGGGKTGSGIIGIAAVGLALITCLLEGRVARPPAFLFTFGALVAWQLATYFWSYDQSMTLVRAATMIQLLAMIWLIAESCVGERERLQLMQAFVLGCVVTCLVLVYAYSSGQSIADYRYAPEVFDPNDSAVVIAAGIPMALLITTSAGRSLFRWVNVAYVPLALFAVILTASRTGFISACVGLLGVFFVLRFTNSTYCLLWSVVILAIFIAVFFLLPVTHALEQNIERITFAGDVESLSTLTNRTNIWAAGRDMFFEHPAGGVGFGTFAAVAEIAIGKWRVAHNLWIQTAAETGVVGLTLLITALGAALIPALRCRGFRVPFHILLFLTLMTMSLALDVVANKSLWIALALLSVARPLLSYAPVAEEPRGLSAKAGALQPDTAGMQ